MQVEALRGKDFREQGGGSSGGDTGTRRGRHAREEDCSGKTETEVDLSDASRHVREEGSREVLRRAAAGGHGR